jgi:hypothetical protein
MVVGVRQKYLRIPRPVSWVTGLAASGALVGATQTFRTPFTGARNAIWRPSGLIRRAALSGLPKRISRGMSGGAADIGGVSVLAVWVSVGATQPAASSAASVGIRAFDNEEIRIIGTPYGGRLFRA